jgi:aclacinomycin oxidase
MATLSRRRLLGGVGAAAAGVALEVQFVGAPASAAPAPSVSTHATASTLVTLTPSDRRWADISLRGYNRRCVSHPAAVRIVANADQVRQAVNDAVHAGQRIAIRSGGHCLEAIVDNDQTQLIIDFTEMRAIDYDLYRNAFVVEAGATLGEIYRHLNYRWGVTLPGGLCPTVGAGGHITGGGFGALSRQYGVITDHLYAVEVVVVGSDGTARMVVATRESTDPNRDLWWAHAGGGGGNFGVATRFWFRSPGVKSTDPTKLLPPSPGAVMTAEAVYKWSDLTQDSFVQLGRNFGAYLEQHSAPGQPENALHATFAAPRVEAGSVVVIGQLDPTVSGNPQLLDTYLAQVGAGVAAKPIIINTGTQPWLSSTINVPDSSAALGVTGPPRWKSNVSALKKRYTDAQLAKAFAHQTSSGYTNPASTFAMTSYGGQINAVATDATAMPHRGCIILAAVSTVWDDPAADTANLDWARNFFFDLYADTGGVPVLNDQTDGCPINWPNIDLVGLPWNTSTTSVHTLYHTTNYGRLQQIKARYDPLNVFRHPLSVELPT